MFLRKEKPFDVKNENCVFYFKINRECFRLKIQKFATYIYIYIFIVSPRFISGR